MTEHLGLKIKTKVKQCKSNQWIYISRFIKGVVSTVKNNGKSAQMI